jgi:hypothetical protein
VGLGSVAVMVPEELPASVAVEPESAILAAIRSGSNEGEGVVDGRAVLEESAAPVIVMLKESTEELGLTTSTLSAPAEVVSGILEEVTAVSVLVVVASEAVDDVVLASVMLTVTVTVAVSVELTMFVVVAVTVEAILPEVVSDSGAESESASEYVGTDGAKTRVTFRGAESGTSPPSSRVETLVLLPAGC